jgi:hypothetical protein
MNAKPEADRDGLIFVIAEIALNNDMQMRDVTWEELPDDARQTLRSALNEGIDPQKVRLRFVTYSDGPKQIHYVVAAHRDEVADFSAYYIAQGSWLVASYEN